MSPRGMVSASSNDSFGPNDALVWPRASRSWKWRIGVTDCAASSPWLPILTRRVNVPALISTVGERVMLMFFAAAGRAARRMSAAQVANPRRMLATSHKRPSQESALRSQTLRATTRGAGLVARRELGSEAAEAPQVERDDRAHGDRQDAADGGARLAGLAVSGELPGGIGEPAEQGGRDQDAVCGGHRPGPATRRHPQLNSRPAPRASRRALTIARGAQ